MCESEITLPCILGRLSKLEREDFSYGQLLDGFAGQRRIHPLKKADEPPSAMPLAVDPAEETDAIVQVRIVVRPLTMLWSLEYGNSSLEDYLYPWYCLLITIYSPIVHATY